MDATTQAEQALGLPPGARGRLILPADTDEAKAVKLSTLKREIGSLMKAYRRARLAMEDVNARAQALGERTNCKAVTLKRLVRVSYAGKYRDACLALEVERDLFEAVGEVPGGEGAE